MSNQIIHGTTIGPRLLGTEHQSLKTGGTAGLVLANRLTESGNQRVLVLEAGQQPTIVAAYATPGGNQFLKGKFDCLADRLFMTNEYNREYHRLELCHCPADRTRRPAATISA